jgi:MFS family permease
VGEPRTPTRWRNVWLLAATSLVADVSGEMLQAVLPFLLVAQGATGLGIGLAGGIDGLGHVFKLVGGYLGERVRRKRFLVAAGYFTAALSRFGIAFAPFWQLSLAFRAVDRMGKGVREAPRDTILADSVPQRSRGRAFGLHRAGDTLGAVVGVALALAILWQAYPEDGGDLGPEETRRIDGLVVLVGACIGLAAAVPVLFVREEPDGAEEAAARAEAPSPRYRSYLLVAGLFYLGHVSYLFFILRAADAPSGPVPALLAAVVWYLVFNVVYVAASYPAGVLTDRLGRTRVLVVGYGLSAAASVAFVLQPSFWTLAGGFVALGFSYAATEGVGRALAADLAGSQRRSRRMGWYHFTVGSATLVGGVAAGLLWDRFGHGAAFAWGAAVSTVALVALALWAARGNGGAWAPTPAAHEEA